MPHPARLGRVAVSAAKIAGTARSDAPAVRPHQRKHSQPGFRICSRVAFSFRSHCGHTCRHFLPWTPGLVDTTALTIGL